MELNHKGVEYTFSNEELYSYNQLLDKSLFYVKNKDKEDNIKTLSNIYINVKYFNCEYSPEVMNKIKSYSKR